MEVIIPPSIIEIGFKAFEGCFYLKTVVIKGNIQYIDSTSFQECTGIKIITYYGRNIIGEISLSNPNNIQMFVCKYYRSNKCFGLDVIVNENCTILQRTYCSKPNRYSKTIYM